MIRIFIVPRCELEKANARITELEKENAALRDQIQTAPKPPPGTEPPLEGCVTTAEPI